MIDIEFVLIKGMDALSREATLKGSALKGKNLHFLGANSFLIEEENRPLFRRGLVCRKVSRKLSPM